jgi:hypothetical protein
MFIYQILRDELYERIAECDGKISNHQECHNYISQKQTSHYIYEVNRVRKLYECNFSLYLLREGYYKTTKKIGI